MKNIEGFEEFKNLLLSNKKIIDVRAPIEFQQGHLPNAINLPILNNEERAHIGTVYKKHGREQAVKEGHEIVSGENKSAKMQAWAEQFSKAPGETVIYCFRGGQRSQITQKWMQEAGMPVPLIVGGYKAFRTFLIEYLELNVPKYQFVPISGRTGSNKTKLIHQLKFEKMKSSLDLEGLANHRGSAFGGLGAQPAQAQFENLLARDFIFLKDKTQIIIEDESRLIGKCVIPDVLFNKMRESAIVWVEEDIAIRAQNILADYVLTPLATSSNNEEMALEQIYNQFQHSLRQIKNKLGGLRCLEIEKDIHAAKDDFIKTKDPSLNLIWIKKLLSYYYDPMYDRSLEKRNPQVLIRGNYQEVLTYLSSIRD